MVLYDEGKVAFGLRGSPRGESAFSDRLRQPDRLSRLTPASKARKTSKRLTALRPCLTTGLPLSYAIVTF